MARLRPARHARWPQNVAITAYGRKPQAAHATRYHQNDSVGTVAQIMRSDTMQLSSQKEIFRQLLHAPLGIPSPADQDIALAREEIFRACATYLPETIRQQLGLSRLQQMPTHISGLMALALQDHHDISAMAFIKQTYHLAQIIQGLAGIGRSVQECVLLREAGEKTIATLFEQSHEQTRTGSLYCTFRQKGRHQRCFAASFNRADLPKNAEIDALRNIPLWTVKLDSRETTVAVYARAKQPLSTYLRFLRERTLSDARIPDPFGFRFVFATADDRRAFKQLLEKRFPEILATRRQYLNKYEESGDRRPNPFSARLFRAEMWYSSFAGARWEFQLMEAPDFVNLWCSTGAENWYFYRLRQLITLFFKHCFPNATWGKGTKKKCQQRIIDVYRGKIAP